MADAECVFSATLAGALIVRLHPIGTVPIYKDENGKRWVEMQFLTPGTPEQVWQAMSP
jgi:hypothetical protein